MSDPLLDFIKLNLLNQVNKLSIKPDSGFYDNCYLCGKGLREGEVSTCVNVLQDDAIKMVQLCVNCSALETYECIECGNDVIYQNKGSKLRKKESKEGRCFKCLAGETKPD